MNIEEQKNLWGNPNNWVDDGHEWSEYFVTTDNLWNNIYPKMEKYLNGEVLEIAPGYGRITKYLLELEKVDDLSVIDLNRNCIAKCIDKFGSKIKNYIVNDGLTLNFNDNTFDFIISFDSFVHMTKDVIESYIKEIYRTLKSGGYGFIHHSHFYSESQPTKNIAGRSDMNPMLFKEYVEKYNMEIISQEDFRTSSVIRDTISIFKKN